jgi:hypothetical protein
MLRVVSPTSFLDDSVNKDIDHMKCAAYMAFCLSHSFIFFWLRFVSFCALAYPRGGLGVQTPPPPRNYSEVLTKPS